MFVFLILAVLKPAPTIMNLIDYFENVYFIFVCHVGFV